VRTARTHGTVTRARALGLCLVVAFAMSALAAAPALAANPRYSTNTWEQYKYCPVNNPLVETIQKPVFEGGEGRTVFCFAGITSGGKEGGYFQLGNVKVNLTKPITLQGAYYTHNEKEEEEDLTGFEANAFKILAAENGGQTLESPELVVSGGLALITKQIRERAKWPSALTDSFNEAKRKKQTGMKVKVELAGGNLLYETWGAVNISNILFGKGIGFKLPLKVRIINPWLEELGGGPCDVGNEAHPIMQNLTTAPPGRSGELSNNEELTNLELTGSRLWDYGWPVEVGAEASGCGGSSYESYVDSALNDVLELNTEGGLTRQSGVTVLQGNLFDGPETVVKRELERGTE
jgi:hypothetical protein